MILYTLDIVINRLLPSLLTNPGVILLSRFYCISIYVMVNLDLQNYRKCDNVDIIFSTFFRYAVYA